MLNDEWSTSTLTKQIYKWDHKKVGAKIIRITEQTLNQNTITDRHNKRSTEFFWTEFPTLTVSPPKGEIVPQFQTTFVVTQM